MNCEYIQSMPSFDFYATYHVIKHRRYMSGFTCFIKSKNAFAYVTRRQVVGTTLQE